MALKDILVHLDATVRAEARLRLAADLARRHDAHLTALFVIDLATPAMLASEASGGAVLANLLEDMRRDALADGARTEAAFRERLRLDGIAGEWRQVEGIARETVVLHARYADLVVLGQADPDDGDMPGAASLVEQALFSSGRPVLVVPYAGQFATIGRRILIGWNAGREAARAVNDALPLIRQAELATVLAVNPRRGIGTHGDEPGG
jgi:nucleotide-binding universal stress UspA family protein